MNTLSTLHRPNWTVLYNIAGKDFIGTGWEFFYDKETAAERYRDILWQGSCPTLRPFYEESDRQHMGAIHRSKLVTKGLSDEQIPNAAKSGAGIKN